MATITGLKLSELQSLGLGSTGTKFYAVTAGVNSFQMSEVALYNTLYKHHISGVFTPYTEDWRFVHKTGTESITGVKIFANYISGFNSNSSINIGLSTLKYSDVDSLDWGGRALADTNAIYGLKWGDRTLLTDTSVITVDWQNKILHGNWMATGITGTNFYLNSNPSGFIPTTLNIVYGANGLGAMAPYSRILLNGSDLLANQVMAWQSGWLLSGGQAGGNENVRLDWLRRILSGSWTAEQLKGMQLVMSGTPPSTPTSIGISGQLATSGQKLFVCTGTNKWGYVNITPW